jgi:hypothetical protein
VALLVNANSARYLLYKVFARVLKSHVFADAAVVLFIPESHIEPPSGDFQVQECVLQPIHHSLIQL